MGSASHRMGWYLSPQISCLVALSISAFGWIFSMARMGTVWLPQNFLSRPTPLVTTACSPRYAVDCVNPRETSGILPPDECPASPCQTTTNGRTPTIASTVLPRSHLGLMGERQIAGNHDMHVRTDLTVSEMQSLSSVPRDVYRYLIDSLCESIRPSH